MTLRVSRASCVKHTTDKHHSHPIPLFPPSLPGRLDKRRLPRNTRAHCAGVRRAYVNPASVASVCRHADVLSHSVTWRKEMTPILSDFLCDNPAAGALQLCLSWSSQSFKTGNVASVCLLSESWSKKNPISTTTDQFHREVRRWAEP